MSLTEPSHLLPDLQIFVRRLVPDDPRKLMFAVRAADPALGLNLKDFGPVPLDMAPEEYVQGVFQDIQFIPVKTEEDREVARQQMESKGGHLFKRLLPEDLQGLLWSLQGKVSSVQFVSDDPHIPWELLRLRIREGKRWVEGPFLCEAFALTRWLRQVAEIHSLPVRRLAFVIPERSALPSSALEREDLLRLRGIDREATEIRPQRRDVLAALSTGDFDAWHFGGHGSALKANADLWSLELDDYPLTPEDLGARAANVGISNPLVFFNSCSIGRSGRSLVGMGGWPRALLDVGVGAFIGALWTIQDRQARAFARAFYELFLRGIPIGEAVRQARLRIKDGNPTWLAYTVFAHPLATCTSRPARASVEIEAPSQNEFPKTDEEPSEMRNLLDFRRQRKREVQVDQKLPGRIGVSREWGSSWIDLASTTDFKEGDRLKFTLDGSARRILVRFLPKGSDPNQPVGLASDMPFEVPETKIMVLTLEKDHPNITQISVHGGVYAWDTSLGEGNGPIALRSVERLADEEHREQPAG